MKRKCSVITGQIKNQLCQQSDLVIYVSREPKIDVSKSTIGDTLRHSDKVEKYSTPFFFKKQHILRSKAFYFSLSKMRSKKGFIFYKKHLAF